MSSVETTDKRLEVEVPSTAVMDFHRSMKSHVTVREIVSVSRV